MSGPLDNKDTHANNVQTVPTMDMTITKRFTRISGKAYNLVQLGNSDPKKAWKDRRGNRTKDYEEMTPHGKLRVMLHGKTPFKENGKRLRHWLYIAKKYSYYTLYTTVIIIYACILAGAPYFPLYILVDFVLPYQNKLLFKIRSSAYYGIKNLQIYHKHKVSKVIPLQDKDRVFGGKECIQKAPIFLGERSQHIPIYFSKNHTNLLVSLIDRVLAKQYDPNKDCMRQYRKFMREIYIPELVKGIKIYSDRFGIKYDPIEYRDHLIGKKKKEYDRALLKLTDAPIKPTYVAMMKREKLFDDNGSCPDPRNVNVPSDDAKCVMGPYFYAFEKTIKNILAAYCPSCSILELGDHVSNIIGTIKKPIIIATDVSRFDASMRTMVMKELNVIYDHFDNFIMGNINTEALQFLQHVGLNLKTHRIGMFFKMRCDGEEPSGKGDTLVFNTILDDSYQKFIFHMAGIKYYILKNSIVTWKEPAPFISLVKGDDNFIAIESSHLKQYLKYLPSVYAGVTKCNGLGPVLKMITISDKYFEFLSLHFVKDKRGRWIPVRPLNRLLQMISFSDKLKNQSDILGARELMWCEANNILSTYRGLPIFDSIGELLLRHGTEVPEERFRELLGFKIHDYDYKKWNDKYDEYAVEAIKEYWFNRHGIDEGDIMRFQNAIKDLGAFSIVQDPLVDKIYDHSNLGLTIKNGKLVKIPRSIGAQTLIEKDENNRILTSVTLVLNFLSTKTLASYRLKPVLIENKIVTQVMMPLGNNYMQDLVLDQHLLNID